MEVDTTQTFIPYIWVGFGILMMIVVIFGIRWAYKNGELDEDIKYEVFNEPGDPHKKEYDAYVKRKEAEEKERREKDKKAV